MKTLCLVLATLATMAVGCSSTAKSPKPDPAKINWTERIGSYTYEQVVAELGNPAVIGESNEGRLAEWVLRRSAHVSFGFGVGTGSYGPHGGVGVGVGSTMSPPPRGDYLQLKFGADGKLREWTKVHY